MDIPIYYTKEELIEILKRNKIDLDTCILDCKEYMYLNGWTLVKNRIVEKDSLILYNGVIKKISKFKGREICIKKKSYKIISLMENEIDAFLVCIIEAIKIKK